MATRTTTRLRGTHGEAGHSVRAFEAAGGPHADVPIIGGGRDSASGGAGEQATAGTGRGAGIGATLGTLLGGSAGLMAGIGALPVPGAGPVVAAGWLVAVLTGAGVGAAAGGMLGSLIGAGGDEGDAHVHAEAVRRDATALPARVEEAEAARPEPVLAGGGGHVDAAPRHTEHRTEGCNRLGPAAPDYTAPDVQAERKRRVRMYGTRATADAAAHRGAEAAQQGGRSTDDAPPRGVEATADTISGVQAEPERRAHVHGAHTAADVAVHQAVQRGDRSASEAPRQGAEVTADVARRGSEAEVEPARLGAQALVESQRRSAHDPAEPVEEVSREVAEAARDTTEEARRVAAAPPGAAEGRPRDLQQSVAGLFEGVAQTNLRVSQDLFRLSDPAPFVELQQRFAREYTDALVRNGATLVRAVRRTADETLRPLEEQIERQRCEQANQNQGPSRVQTAAE
jgi:hypothetical protein